MCELTLKRGINMKIKHLITMGVWLTVLAGCTSVRLSLETKPIVSSGSPWTQHKAITSTGSRGTGHQVVLTEAQDIRINTTAKTKDAKITEVTIDVVTNGLNGVVTRPRHVDNISPGKPEVNGGIRIAANQWESLTVKASAKDSKGRQVTTGSYELQLFQLESLSWRLAKVGGSGEIDFQTQWLSRRPPNWPNDDPNAPVDRRTIGFIQNNGNAAVTIDFISIATGQILETFTVQPGATNRNRKLAGRTIGSGYFRIIGGSNPGSSLQVAF